MSKIRAAVDLWERYPKKFLIYVMDGVSLVTKHGAGNPFVKVIYDKQKEKTQVLKHAEDAKWRELFLFEVTDDHAEITLEVWTKGGISEKMIGFCNAGVPTTFDPETVIDRTFDLEIPSTVKAKDKGALDSRIGNIRVRFYYSSEREIPPSPPANQCSNFFYRDFAHQMKTGDMIVYSGVGSVDALSKIHSGSKYSRAGIVVRLPNKYTRKEKLYIFEVTRNLGKELDAFRELAQPGASLFKLFEHLHAVNATDIWLVPLKQPIEADACQNMTDWIKEHVSKHDKVMELPQPPQEMISFFDQFELNLTRSVTTVSEICSASIIVNALRLGGKRFPSDSNYIALVNILAADCWSDPILLRQRNGVPIPKPTPQSESSNGKFRSPSNASIHTPSSLRYSMMPDSDSNPNSNYNHNNGVGSPPTSIPPMPIQKQQNQHQPPSVQAQQNPTPQQFFVNNQPIEEYSAQTMASTAPPSSLVATEPKLAQPPPPSFYGQPTVDSMNIATEFSDDDPNNPPPSYSNDEDGGTTESTSEKYATRPRPRPPSFYDSSSEAMSIDQMRNHLAVTMGTQSLQGSEQTSTDSIQASTSSSKFSTVPSSMMSASNVNLATSPPETAPKPPKKKKVLVKKLKVKELNMKSPRGEGESQSQESSALESQIPSQVTTAAAPVTESAPPSWVIPPSEEPPLPPTSNSSSKNKDKGEPPVPAPKKKKKRTEKPAKSKEGKQRQKSDGNGVTDEGDPTSPNTNVHNSDRMSALPPADQVSADLDENTQNEIRRRRVASVRIIPESTPSFTAAVHAEGQQMSGHQHRSSLSGRPSVSAKMSAALLAPPPPTLQNPSPSSSSTVVSQPSSLNSSTPKSNLSAPNSTPTTPRSSVPLELDTSVLVTTDASENSSNQLINQDEIVTVESGKQSIPNSPRASSQISEAAEVSSSAPISTVPDPKCYAMVIWSFEAQYETEMSVTEGEKVAVLDSDGDWTYICKDGKAGAVPSSFLSTI